MSGFLPQPNVAITVLGPTFMASDRRARAAVWCPVPALRRRRDAGDARSGQKLRSERNAATGIL